MPEFPPPSTQTVIKGAKTYARDLAERVVATFVQAFLGAFVLTQPLDLHMWQAAAVAGVAAAASLLKGLAARWRDVTNSASLARGV
ncbi:holin [Streptomyces sp. NPDC006539]|uniref:holin n=1 Tax=Streptomyces sp. NPDC006539 TaxID=3155352 RepID=UPI0033A45A30